MVMAAVEVYTQSANSKKILIETEGFAMSLDQFKSQVIILLQQLIKLCETEQQEAITFLNSNIDSIKYYIEESKCVTTESDNSFDSVNNDDLENNEAKLDVLKPCEGIEENSKDVKHSFYEKTENLSSDIPEQNSENLSSNDKSNDETQADKINNPFQMFKSPVKSSKKSPKTKELLNCAICKETFKTLPHFVRHLTKHDGTQISCIHCKKHFDNYITFNVHKSICETCRNIKEIKGAPFIFDRKKIANLQLSKVLCCPFCGESYSSGYNLRRHIDTKKCRYTDDKESDDVVRCKYCNTIFTNQEKYNEHIKNKHVRPCGVCGPLIMSVRDWKRHKKTHEEQQIEIRHSCKVCLQHFRTRQLLREHSRQHRPDLKNIKTIDSRHRCKECSYASDNLSNLLRHTNLKHKPCSIDKKFSCHKCPRMFKLNNALKEHLATVHSTERPLVCPVCPASFKLPSLLSRHMAGHSSARLTCACCHQRFHRQDGLRRHLRKHRAKPDQTHGTTLQIHSSEEISVMAPQALELAAPACADLLLPSGAGSELIISTPARSDLMTSTPARSELVSLMDLQSGEMLTLSPADYMLYLSS